EPKANFLKEVFPQSTNLGQESLRQQFLAIKPGNKETQKRTLPEPYHVEGISDYDVNRSRIIEKDDLLKSSNLKENDFNKSYAVTTKERDPMTNSMTNSMTKERDPLEDKKLLSDEVQYFSMVNYILVLILLVFYAFYRFNKKPSKNNQSGSNIYQSNQIEDQEPLNYGKNRAISSLTKMTFILSILSSIFLIGLLIHVKLPLRNLELGEIGDYQVKISKEYYTIWKTAQQKTSQLGDGAKSMLSDVRGFLKKSFAKITGNYYYEERGNDDQNIIKGDDEKRGNDENTVKSEKSENTVKSEKSENTIKSENTENIQKQNDNNDSFKYFSLTPLINILYSLSHILLISSILLFIMIRYEKKENFTLNVKKDGNMRWLIISYAILRIPLLIFLDYSAISKNQSVLFIKAVYYGSEGYFTAALVFLTILNIKDKKSKFINGIIQKNIFSKNILENEHGISDIKSNMKSNIKSDIESNMKNIKNILYLIMTSLIVYTFLKHTLQILSLPVKLNPTFFYILNRIEELSGMVIGLGIIEGVTR
ncbi:hypothetical protein M153_36310001659, partial [Pseudoloma neurophilia]